MRRLTAIATGALLALMAASAATAGPLYTGTTEVPEPQPAETTIDVEVSITSEGPVVPYDFAIQNECKLPDRTRTYQRDDIAAWTFEEDGVPHAIMPVYLQSIPEGADCKVSLMHGNVQVKGSVTSYVVDAPPGP